MPKLWLSVAIPAQTFNYLNKIKFKFFKNHSFIGDKEHIDHGDLNNPIA